MRALSHGESVPVIPGIFHITLVWNSGIAFGLFRHNPAVLFFLISLSLLILFYFAQRFVTADFWPRTAMFLILGGAIGNWFDRLRFQAVVDFIDWRIWPVFNLADSGISVGVFIFLMLVLFGHAGENRLRSQDLHETPPRDLK